MLLERIDYPEDFPVRVTIAHMTEDPIHYHTDIEFVYVLKGEVQLKNGYCRYQLHAGDIFTNAGSEVHSIAGVTGDNVVARIHISTAQLSRYFPNLHKACYRTYSKKADDRRYSLLKEMTLRLLLKYLTQGPNYQSECLYLVVDIINHLDRYFNLFSFDKDMVVGFEPNNQVASERISRICQYIYQNYAHNITLQDLGEMEYLSTFYLSHLIKDFTGMNFREFLCFARVEMSEARLLGTDMKISQIAKEVGFSTTAYYEKYFTQWFGMSPAAHRAACRPQVKSDLKPAVYEELPREEAVLTVRNVLSHVHGIRGADSSLRALQLDAAVNAEAAALRCFSRPLEVALQCEDYRVLGNTLFGVLSELRPAKILLTPDGTDDGVYEKLVRHLTEYGCCVETRAWADRRHSAAFDSLACAIDIIKHNMEHNGQPLTVALRDTGTGRILQGQPALLTSGGTKKPAYFACRLLSGLRGDVIAGGNQYCIVRSREEIPTYAVIVWHDNDAIARLCREDATAEETRRAINDFRDELSLNVELSLKPGTCSVTRLTLDKENNVFARLSALDFRENALPERLAADLLSCVPVPEMHMEEIRSDCRVNSRLEGAGIQVTLLRSCTGN